ncbi:hypothetical protein PABG_02100 [Paracoccidioides brasiliensis Pb03]|nr:hypothetical protein PABG_02100 [Paracoccidioides brasiliensis Pb03]
MLSSDIDHSQITRRNQWPSTFISPMDFSPPTPGSDLQDTNLNPERVIDEGSLAAGAIGSFGLKSWTADNQTDALMTSRHKKIYESVYSLPYTLNSPKVPMWSTYGIRLPSQYFIPPDFGTSNGMLGNSTVDEVESLPAYSVFNSELPLFPSQLSQVGNVPFANNRKPNQLPSHQSLTLNTNVVTRPLSDSYFSLSNNTGSFDFTSLSAFSEVPSFASDTSSEYTPRSSINLSSTPLSPVPSPRHTQSDLVRGGNRQRASVSPSASIRASPHSLDGVRKRWSTGSYAPRPNRVTSPFLTQNHVSLSRLPSPSMWQNRISSSTNTARQQTGNRSSAQFQQNNLLLLSNFEANVRFRNPAVLASQGAFRTLPSDTDPQYHYFDLYSEFSSPPDLLGPLKEEPVPPPPEDMMPGDPNMIPHKQEIRFEHDLYTPKWVRGHGNKREGWCGICKPGRWLVLKNSAFWYDKSFTHGISAAAGQAFAPPKETRRTEGNTSVWEGLCGNCGDWVALVSSKKKGTTWFRHAYKCHNNNQKNETLKRRREHPPNKARQPDPDSLSKSTSQDSESRANGSINTPVGVSASQRSTIRSR